MNVGDRIRQRRIELNMTQDELARKVGYKTRASINNIELKRDIPMKKLKPIADALEISVYDLMGWQPSEDKYSHINTAAVAGMMLDSPGNELMNIFVELEPEKKIELVKFAKYLKMRED